jgi:hypothetical protein
MTVNPDAYAIPDGIVDFFDQHDLGLIQTYVMQDSDGKYLTRSRTTIADRTHLSYARVTELFRKHHSGIRIQPINLDSDLYK